MTALAKLDRKLYTRMKIFFLRRNETYVSAKILQPFRLARLSKKSPLIECGHEKQSEWRGVFDGKK